MDWRIKCVALQLMRVLPGSAVAHRALQRYVTGRFLPAIGPAELGVHRFHVENYLRLARAGVALEFGAGGPLLTCLLLAAAGAREVLALDIERLATVERVNHAIGRLRALQVPGDWREVADLGDDLFRRYRIRYLAPADARSTGLREGSVDFFCSTSVLEHVAAPDIARILRECARIASPDALFSFSIDYKDHYAGFDSSITRGNFYRFDEREWARYNPPRHFQNRLRHSDFEKLFHELGFEIRSAQRWSVGQPGDLDGVPLAAPFRRYSAEDLLTYSGRFVLAARAPGHAPA